MTSSYPPMTFAEVTGMINQLKRDGRWGAAEEAQLFTLNRSPAGSQKWHEYRSRVLREIWDAAYRRVASHSSRRVGDGALDPARPKRDPRPVKNRRSGAAPRAASNT